MNTYLSTTAVITSIPSIESDTQVIIVFIIIMIAVTVVLILITSIWFGTLLCLDGTFTSTATGLSTKEANPTKSSGKENPEREVESKKLCINASWFCRINIQQKSETKNKKLTLWHRLQTCCQRFLSSFFRSGFTKKSTAPFDKHLNTILIESFEDITACKPHQCSS